MEEDVSFLLNQHSSRKFLRADGNVSVIKERRRERSFIIIINVTTNFISKFLRMTFSVSISYVTYILIYNI